MAKANIMSRMIHNNFVPQKKNTIAPNKIYFRILNHTGWECFERATSNSRLIDLGSAIEFRLCWCFVIESHANLTHFTNNRKCYKMALLVENIHDERVYLLNTKNGVKATLVAIGRSDPSGRR